MQLRELSSWNSILNTQLRELESVNSIQATEPYKNAAIHWQQQYPEGSNALAKVQCQNMECTCKGCNRNIANHH